MGDHLNPFLHRGACTTRQPPQQCLEIDLIHCTAHSEPAQLRYNHTLKRDVGKPNSTRQGQGQGQGRTGKHLVPGSCCDSVGVDAGHCACCCTHQGRLVGGME